MVSDNLINPGSAYWHAYFNYKLPNFDLNYYQDIACKSTYYAYCFAEDIPGENLEYCRKACESDEYLLNEFDKMIIRKVML